jgi:hypothetical protein
MPFQPAVSPGQPTLVPTTAASQPGPAPAAATSQPVVAPPTTLSQPVVAPPVASLQAGTPPAIEEQVIIYGHSPMLYWWPVWVTGYIMALATWLHPVAVQIGERSVELYPTTTVGVVFTVVLLLTLVITNTNMRGLISLVVVLLVAFLALLCAYLDWWPTILDWFWHQSIFLNLGFYLFFSTAFLVIWLATVLVFDHLDYWRVRAGQVTHEFVLGAVEASYDTDSMVFTKQQDDLFRHWVMGLGSGDLQMQTMGGRGVLAKVSNVLFLSSTVARIQRLIATKPDVPGQT